MRALAAARPRTAQPVIARKAKSGDHEECPYCQQKSRISQPGDPLEHEADRAADAVMNRAALPALNPAAGQFQRDPSDAAPHDEPHTRPADAGTLIDALAKTHAGQQLVAKGEEQGLRVLSNPAAAATAGVMAGGAVAGLASAHRPLPVQPPALPLGHSGLHAGIRYQGPVNAPTYVGATLSGTLPGEPKAKKPAPHDAAAYRAETERMRAELDRWKPRPQPAAPSGAALAPPMPPPASIHAPAPAPLQPRKKDGAAAVQRKADSRAEAPAPVAETIDENGAALEGATRRFMEQRFGRDFSAVRIHTGPGSARATDALRARAFTYGEHVVFASGEYRPATESGRRLRAHELAHVAHQRAAPLRATAASMPMRRQDAAVVAPLSAAPMNTISREAAPELKDEPIKIDDLSRLSGLEYKVSRLKESDKDNGGPLRYEVAPLYIPIAKGQRVLPIYKARTSPPGLLSSTIELQPKPHNAKERNESGSDKRREDWLTQVGWTNDNKDANWAAAGGAASFPDRTVGNKKKPCDLDHIVELQLGGEDEIPNFQVLDSCPNRSSGSTLKNQVYRIAQAIKKYRETKAFSDKDRSLIQLIFTGAEMGDSPDTPCKTSGVIGKETCDKGKDANGKVTEASSCLAVENCAVKGKGGGAAPPSAPTESYKIKASNTLTVDFKVPQGFKDTADAKPVSLDTGENAKAAGFIKGFTAKTLSHTAAKKNVKGAVKGAPGAGGPGDTITFEVSQDLKALKGKETITFPIKSPDNTLDLVLPKKLKGIPIDFAAMSPAEITSFKPGEDGIDFSGDITPTIPFLGKLGFEYVAGALSITKGLEPRDLPIPGAKIDKADLALAFLPTLEAKGGLSMSYKRGGRKLLDLSLNASANANGFLFGGDLTAFLPGAEATGHVDYSKEKGWSGKAELKIDDLKKKLKVVTGGSVSVSFRNDGKGGFAFDAEGRISLDIPRAHDAALSLISKDGHWLFTGGATFDVPRLKPVTLNIAYDGKALSGDLDNVGFRYKQFGGTLHLQYRDEKLFGKGQVEIKHERVKGKLDVSLLPDDRLTGGGELTIQIREGLEATAGVELDEKEILHVKGKLAFTKPIKLFDAFGHHANIFTAKMDIPIPGANIAGVGVNARIEGALDAGYSIGPGEIRHAEAEVKLKPLEEKPDLSFKASGELWIGAHADIKGSVTGSVVLTAYVAEVAGGLTVSATADLTGNVSSAVELNYADSRYWAEADFQAALGLAIMLALEASVHANAGFGPFKVGTEYRWTLAQRQFDTGLKLGIKLKKKLRYSSDKSFEIPSASDIEITKPNLDPKRLIDDVFKASDPQKKEKAQ
jgi:hypothetical protein